MPPRGQRLNAATEPAEVPRELILYASRSKAFVVFLIGIAFCAAGYFMIPRIEWVGWLSLIFGAVGSLAGLLLLLFPRLTSLHLTAEGFTSRTLLGACLIRWQDVAGFQVGSISGTTMVLYNFVPGYTGKKFGRMLSSDLAGWEAGIADMYGIPPAELADLMNAWKRHSLGKTL